MRAPFEVVGCGRPCCRRTSRCGQSSGASRAHLGDDHSAITTKTTSAVLDRNESTLEIHAAKNHGNEIVVATLDVCMWYDSITPNTLANRYATVESVPNTPAERTRRRVTRHKSGILAANAAKMPIAFETVYTSLLVFSKPTFGTNPTHDTPENRRLDPADATRTGCCILVCRAHAKKYSVDGAQKKESPA